MGERVAVFNPIFLAARAVKYVHVYSRWIACAFSQYFVNVVRLEGDIWKQNAFLVLPVIAEHVARSSEKA